VSTEALFEDRHTDALMRWTIPQFARLGAASVAVTAPFATPELGRRLFLLGLAASAVVIAQIVAYRDLVSRLSRDVIFCLLLAFCTLIALAVAATRNPDSPYGLLYLIPILFTAVFFTGWTRYATAGAANAINYLIVGQVLHVDAGGQLIRLAMCLLLAHFGAVVAETLREALRANNALHKVLEAASGHPLDGDLARIGTEAALSVANWDAAGVILLAADGKAVLPVVRGLSPQLTAVYTEGPIELESFTAIGPRLPQGVIQQFEDLSKVLPDDNPLRVEGIVSLAVVPIGAGGTVMGALLVGHRSPRRLDERALDRLVWVADQLGLALGSVRAFRRETAVAENLRELNERKDEFLANISHELRTPAATIKLIASTLQRSSHQLDASQLREMFDTLERRSAHLTELISDLLDEAVAGAGETRLSIGPIDWCACIQRWSGHAMAQTGRSIAVHLPETQVTGAGDAAKLERVIVNLLTNAAKFSSPESNIGVYLRALTGFIEVEVRDTGIGISNDHLEQIFDRFHQVDGGSTRIAGGFGLGLSLARHFVEAHGGTLTVTSEPGEGSVFLVRVPASPVPVAS